MQLIYQNLKGLGFSEGLRKSFKNQVRCSLSGLSRKIRQYKEKEFNGRKCDGGLFKKTEL